jgi:hypothetical protein
MFPWPHEVIVVVPPASRTSALSSAMAVGTLVSFILFRASEPSSRPLLAEVQRKIGVFVTVASIIASLQQQAGFDFSEQAKKKIGSMCHLWWASTGRYVKTDLKAINEGDRGNLQLKMRT